MWLNTSPQAGRRSRGGPKRHYSAPKTKHRRGPAHGVRPVAYSAMRRASTPDSRNDRIPRRARAGHRDKASALARPGTGLRTSSFVIWAMAIVEGDSMLARVVFVRLALGASAVSFGQALP